MSETTVSQGLPPFIYSISAIVTVNKVRNMFKVNNRCTRCHSGVFVSNIEYISHVVPMRFLLTLNMEMKDGILYCLILDLSMHFRAGSRSPVTFKMKLYVTTVNNSFQQLPIFNHNKLHNRCCIGLGLNIVTRTSKIIIKVLCQAIFFAFNIKWTIKCRVNINSVT